MKRLFSRSKKAPSGAPETTPETSHPGSKNRSISGIKGFQSGIGKRGTNETAVTEAVKRFCDSGSPNNPNAGGDEITHLPTIVEGAESSPAAAGAAAVQIRKLIKNAYSKPYIQYNCIMLMRILVDNPGPQFTRNFDPKFILTIKTCLQSCRDPSVQQILRETLYYFASTKQSDTNLGPLLNMWQQEQTAYPGGRSVGPPPQGSQQHQPRDHHHNRSLPPPEELAARISEAKASAQLLIQLSESTPPQEVPGNELMKEFADRVQSANRNLHACMNCQDPPPDEQTFATLIETCEQLSVASSRHQRAVLASRQQLGISPQVSNGASPQPPQMVQPVQNQQYQPRGLSAQDQQRASYIPPTGIVNPSEQQRTSYMQPSPMMVQQPQQVSRAFGQPQSSNPFSDDNSIPTQAPQINHDAKPAPYSNIYELPASTHEDYTAPVGPPPTNGIRDLQTQPPHAALADDDEDYDLYNTDNSPVLPTHAQNHIPQSQFPTMPTSAKPTSWEPSQATWNNIASNARSQQPQELPAPAPVHVQQGLAPSRPDIPGVTQSYVGRQYTATSGMTMHGASPPPSSNGAGAGGKAKDDEPMTPVTPSGWH